MRNKAVPAGRQGFTLVELLLYTTLIGVVVAAVAVVLVLLQRQRVRSQVITEVEEQGTGAMQIMTQIVRNATGINSPAIGASGSTLSVSVTTGALSPTVFSLSGGVLRMTEGVAAAVDLTSAKVTVSSLTFYNLSRSGTPGTIRIVYTVSYNATGPVEYSYSKVFTSDASLR